MTKRSITLLAILAGLYVMPLLWVVSYSLRGPGDARASAFALPVDPGLDAYRRGFAALDPLATVPRTCVLVIVATFVAIFPAAALAFTLRGTPRLRGAARWMCFLLSVAPHQFSIVPLLHVMSALGIAGSTVGVALCMGGSMIPISTLVLDAQMERRCGDHFLLLRLYGVRPITGFVLLWPILWRGVAALALIGVLRFWTTLYYPLLLTLGRPDIQPVSVRLYHLVSLYPTDWTLQIAAAVLASLPGLVIVAFLHVGRTNQDDARGE